MSGGEAVHGVGGHGAVEDASASACEESTRPADSASPERPSWLDEDATYWDKPPHSGWRCRENVTCRYALALESRLAAVEKARDGYKRENDTLRKTTAEAVERAARLKAERDGEVWLWEHGGDNQVESLSCPVLIQPDALRAIIAERDALKQVHAEGAPFRRWAQSYLDAGRFGGHRYDYAVKELLLEVVAERDALRAKLDKVERHAKHMEGLYGQAKSKIERPYWNNAGPNRKRIQGLRRDRRNLQRQWMLAEERVMALRERVTELEAEVARRWTWLEVLGRLVGIKRRERG